MWKLFANSKLWFYSMNLFVIRIFVILFWSMKILVVVAFKEIVKVVTFIADFRVVKFDVVEQLYKYRSVDF